MMKNLLLLVGAPATGKSTITSKLPGGSKVVSSDAVIEAVAKADGKTYSEVFDSTIKHANEVSWENFKSFVDDGETNIVVDRTNMTVKSRKRWLDYAKGKGYNIEAFVLEAPYSDDEVAEWNQRLQSRPGKNVPQHVLDGMLESYQAPTFDEGFNKVHFYNSFSGNYYVKENK